MYFQVKVPSIIRILTECHYSYLRFSYVKFKLFESSLTISNTSPLYFSMWPDSLIFRICQGGYCEHKSNRILNILEIRHFAIWEYFELKFWKYMDGLTRCYKNYFLNTFLKYFWKVTFIFSQKYFENIDWPYHSWK